MSEREYVQACEQERSRERGRERITSRLCAADAGLELINHEVMIWAEIKNWTLNPLSHPGSPNILYILVIYISTHVMHNLNKSNSNSEVVTPNVISDRRNYRSAVMCTNFMEYLIKDFWCVKFAFGRISTRLQVRFETIHWKYLIFQISFHSVNGQGYHMTAVDKVTTV